MYWSVMRRDVDQALVTIGTTQFGAIGRRQARAVGAYERLLHRRVRAGSLLQATERVLVLPAFPASFEQALWIASLDCEGPSFVSHESAARLSELPSFTRDPSVVLTVPHADKRTAVATCHQTRRAFEDLPLQTSAIGLQVSPLHLTVAELATVVSQPRLAMVVEHVLTKRRVRFDLLVEAWRDARARRLDVRALGALLARLGEGADVPTSELNRRLHAVLDLVPGPKATYECPFPGWDLPQCVVDAFLHPELIVVEGDGRAWHTRERDFVRDRQRDRAAARAGCVTIRYSYHELEDVDGVRAEVADLRTRRRRDLGLPPLDLAA